MATRIHFEAELTREGLAEVRDDIERLLQSDALSDADARIEWRLPTEAAKRIDQLWPRLGENLRSLLRTGAMDFDDGEEFTLEDLASKLDVASATVKSWHRNLSRSVKRVDREFGEERPVLEGEWSNSDWRMHYRMPPEVRRAIRNKLQTR